MAVRITANKITLVRDEVELKPLYMSSLWDGQWIKELRELPRKFVDCYRLERVISYSIKIVLRRIFTPRVHYDKVEGRSTTVQIHPDMQYIARNIGKLPGWHEYHHVVVSAGSPEVIM